MASSHQAWSYWSDATVLDDYAMTSVHLSLSTVWLAQNSRKLDVQSLDSVYRLSYSLPVFGDPIFLQKGAMELILLSSFLSASL